MLPSITSGTKFLLCVCLQVITLPYQKSKYPRGTYKGRLPAENLTNEERSFEHAILQQTYKFSIELRLHTESASTGLPKRGANAIMSFLLLSMDVTASLI